MPRAIALETSGRVGSVAVVEGIDVVAAETIAHGLKNAAQVLPMIDRLVKSRGWKPRDVEEVFLSIGPGSFTGLRLGVTIAKTLAENPQIKKVRVEGHTDHVGTDEYNKTLSEQRAQAVVEGLVRLGVDRSRLRAEGLGRSRPLDKNDTESGRANNRRVEFHIEDSAQ